MNSYLQGIVSIIGIWAYLIVFVGVIFEGDIFLFSAFFLAREGVFDVWLLTLVVFFGIIFGDLLWYRLGIKLDKTNSRLLRWAEKIAAPFDGHLISRTFHTIFISKYTYGIHHAILVRAGMLRFPLRRFVGYDAISTSVWIFVVGGLGYFSSLYFSMIKNYIKFAEIGLLLGILLFVFTSHYLAKRSRDIL
ncbi:MAG: VTT domain-containing protein [Patescibacteria group bacterium]|nr:VTT domain-containing protein [Patescibacteria group bacterium]